MFRKLRWQLTLLCVIGTTAVCLAMALVSFRVSQRQITLQADASFRSNMNAVFYYLQAQSVIDQTWLAQTEADNDLWIRIEVDGVPLRYVMQDPQRDSLTRAALMQAHWEWGFNPSVVRSDMNAVTVRSFSIQLDGREYTAAITAMPYADTTLTIVLLKDMRSQQQALRNVSIGFGIIGLAAAGLLTLFAWFFTGRAVRPVEESQRQQNAFIAAASHELRSPLSVIQLGLDRARLHPENAAAQLDMLSRESERMTRLVSDLLLLASTDSGQLSMKRESLSPRTLLLNVFESYETTALRAGIDFTVAFPDLPIPSITGDMQRLEQLLSILVDNAISYTPRGGHIRLCIEKHSDSIELLIVDNGPGIPDNEKKPIFDRFYRNDAAHSDKEHFGLGLSIALSIAAQHKAKLSVRDTPGGGSTFSLLLPAA